MQNDHQLTAAALRWHAAHVRRLEIGREKRRIDAQMRAGGDDAWCLQRCVEQSDAGRLLADAKRKEQAAMRALAAACAKQRGHLQAADVIEVDGAVVLLAGVR